MDSFETLNNEVEIHRIIESNRKVNDSALEEISKLVKENINSELNKINYFQGI